MGLCCKPTMCLPAWPWTRCALRRIYFNPARRRHPAQTTHKIAGLNELRDFFSTVNYNWLLAGI